MNRPDSISLRDYQLILLDILKDVAMACRSLDITFYLGEGTLLGAVRHRGFIPWDDDIDIYMYRKDYDRFLESAGDVLSDRYEVQSHEHLKSFWNAYAQVRLITDDDRLKQRYISRILKNNGPFIDIFPLDYTGKNKGFGLRLRCAKIKLYKAMLTYKYKVCKPAHPKGVLISFLSHFYSTENIFKKIDLLTRTFDVEKKPYTISLHTIHPLKNRIVPSSCFDGVEELDFEDTRFPVPSGYDEVLTTIYGDYMTPPDDAHRTQKHNIGSESK